MQTTKRDAKKAFLVKKVAEKHGVTKDLVYKVLNGDRENEAILTDFMNLKETIDNAIETLQDNPLMHAVRRAVPL